MTTIFAPGYADFLAQLKTQIRLRQYQALRAVNHELVGLYWDLGQSIHTKQSELGWGKAVVQNLASDLQSEFPGRNGFSAQNLWLMLQFFREYSDKPKLQPMVREISWERPVERDEFLPSPGMAFPGARIAMRFACGRGAGGEGAHNAPIRSGDMGYGQRSTKPRSRYVNNKPQIIYQIAVSAKTVPGL